MKVLVHHKMGKVCLVLNQYPCSLSKQARVILLEHLRVSHPHMKLKLFMLQLHLSNQLALHLFPLDFKQPSKAT